MGSELLSEMTIHSIGGGWGTKTPTETNSQCVAIIRGTDIPNLQIGDTGSLPLRYESPRKVSSRKLQEGDLVIEISGGSPTSGQHTGRVLYISQTILDLIGKTTIPASFCRLLRLDRQKVCPLFIKYQIDSMHQTGEIALYEHQSTGISNFQFKTFINEESPLIEEYDSQKAIAYILRTLDDKIELNRRMNETLEAMARAIFKSWFVDFDPVVFNAVRAGNPVPERFEETAARYRENPETQRLPQDILDLFPDRFADSELGAIPAGWEVGIVNDICESIENGGTPKRMESSYWSGNIPWFKTGELHDGPLIDSGEKISHEGLSNSACKLWPEGTILIALYASPTVGRLGILEVPATANQACSALMAKKEYGNLFVFFSLLNSRDRLQQIAVGAAQQNINQKIVRDHKVVIPTAKVVECFQNKMLLIYRKVVESCRECKTLVNLRDTLLPKLISGELRVPDAETFLNEGA